MILRDPVHGLVAFEGREEGIVEDLIDAPEVQRLRRLRQLGVTFLAFPGAEHSRFAHAIGAAFVMKLLLARFRSIDGDLPNGQRITEEQAREALAAALLHDLGHGPLSHLFEELIPGAPSHETWTERIVLDPSSGVHRILAAANEGMPSRVVELVHGRHELPYLAKAVSGELDVDRCDYLLRDAHATGVRYGLYDLDWLLRSLRFTTTRLDASAFAWAPALAIDGAKGLPAVEAFVIARLFMFQQVYLHKAGRAAEWMIRTIVRRALAMLRSGGRLDGVPAALASAARGNSISIDNYLELDDGVLWGAIHTWEQASDKPLADLARRIRARALFKTVELFGEHAAPKGQERALTIAQETAAAHQLDPETYVGLDVAKVLAFEADGEPLMVIHGDGHEHPLHEASFLVGRLIGQVLSRVRLVLAPELRGPVKDALRQ